MDQARFARTAGLLPFLLALGCAPSPAPETPDASLDTGPAPVDAGPPDTSEDVGLDALPPRTHEDVPAAGALVAGVADIAIPVPVGIGTMGFGALGAAPSPSPFAETFPGTTRAHGTLRFRAVAISRGDAHELILVRMDTVGVFQQLREAVLDALETRLGRRLDDALVLAGNHTHSGPGRLLMTTGALVQLGDRFFPEVYDHLVDALADVVEAAIADEAPAELGYAIAHTSDAHHDRRCENDPLPQLQELGDMPLIAVRREGRLDAIVASYAYHGTILDIEQHTLSGDMGGVAERRVEERFDHPVSVLLFNSWGADMAPSDPPIDPSAVGADQPGGYDRMQAIGDVVADTIVPAVATITYGSELEVRARTFRVPLDTTWIGYPTGTFNYPNGGAFCGLGAEGNCTEIAPDTSLPRRCIRIQASEGLPHQTLMTAGQIGDLYFVTAPGEWSTALANGVLAQVRTATGAPDAMLLGYANDYTGYSLNETDWYQGGYEASGALWGPKQGDYLAARLVDVFGSYFERWNEPPWREPAAVPPFSGYTYEPYVPEGATGAGTIATDVAATYTQTDVVSFVVNGSDPWLGAPVATLEHDTGGGTFVPVTRPNGVVVDTTSYDSWIDLAPTPSYATTERTDTRTFAWTIHYPVSTRPGAAVALSGSYRFRVAVPTVSGAVDVTTGTFTVTP
ncbi:MAG: neutral/alkaline non-lysosomal ceramidase N-terminal domain-containing protein [Sandaracinus sp.]